jgi:hypothetical protein
MFLRCSKRKKDGKEHLYWSVVENRRLGGNRVVQRHVLYLGELNGRQSAAWRKTIELVDPESPGPRQVELIPEEVGPVEAEGAGEATPVRVRLDQMRLEHPRQWGACWLACQIWERLGLDGFWADRLPDGREGTPWSQVLQTLVFYRWLAPGSEWHLHRHWYDHTALADLLGSDFSLAEIHRLYECHDRLLAHKTALFSHLNAKWKDLFNARHEVLLYDLTSTYFESPPREEAEDPRRFGYSRDKRSDCVQVVIALVVTPEGFPLAYEMLAGNTQDKCTLRGFLAKIEAQYGKADRVWVMDRGIPTEEVLAEMRTSDPPASYLVGTPKGRLTQLEASLLTQPWHQARPKVRVKLLPHEGETYVLAESGDRVAKERSMRRRRLRKYLDRLVTLRDRKRPLERDALLRALGAAGHEAGKDARHVLVGVPLASDPNFRLAWRIDRVSLRKARQREGRYLLRTNQSSQDPAKLWESYLVLVEVEQAFKELKGDLAIRPIYHQRIERIEAHLFVSFLAYCLQVTLKALLRRTAGGLTPRSVLEKFAAVQMLDVHLPTTDGREIVLSRYTQPEKDLQLLLAQLNLTLPEQPPPRIQSPKPTPPIL